MRIGLKIGTRFGLGVGGSNDAPWVVDGGLGRPANRSEWAALLSSAGLGVSGRQFGYTYNCQEASGNLAEADGGTAFTANGGAGGITYRATVPGFSLKACETTEGGAAGFEIVSGSGPQPGTQSVAMFCRFVVVTLSAAAERAICGTTLTTGNLHLLDIIGTSDLLRYYTNATSVNSVNTYDDDIVHDALLVFDRTNSTSTLYTEEEKRVGTFNAAVANGVKLLGGRTGALSANTQYLYCAMAQGTEAEWTSTQALALFQALGRAPGWS